MGRKEELDDLIAAFDRRCMRSIPIPIGLAVRGARALLYWATEESKRLGQIPCLSIFGIAACLDESRNLRLAMKRLQ